MGSCQAAIEQESDWMQMCIQAKKANDTHTHTHTTHYENCMWECDSTWVWYKARLVAKTIVVKLLYGKATRLYPKEIPGVWRCVNIARESHRKSPLPCKTSKYNVITITSWSPPSLQMSEYNVILLLADKTSIMWRPSSPRITSCCVQSYLS